MSENILIIDDEPAILSTLSGVLMDEGYSVSTVENGAAALREVQGNPPALILLDIWMPEPDGIETLKRLKTLFPDLVVIMMSGHGSIETAVKAIKIGAYDYIEKPISLQKVVMMVEHALTEFRLRQENRTLKRLVEKRYEMIGESGAISRLREQIRMAGPSQSRVLISGENGTGKELVARAIHAASARRNQPFLEINCAAIPENLIESELFGYERGAFSGAQHQKKGQFELADGGTLFLDEIGDMALATQSKVLRVLQEQEFYRVGGSERVKVDVRVIAASNKNLAEEIKKGSFREDLYYRLNVIPLHVPPLRERPEDIPQLLEYFAQEVAQEQGIKLKRFSPEAVAILKRAQWPGNVRELKNIVERLMIMVPAPVVQPNDLPEFITDGLIEENSFPPFEEAAGPGSLKDARNAFEKKYILAKLQEHDWNVLQTAEALQIERTYLYRKMKLLGIEAPGEV
ncbi:MAG: sigma-54-dependent Fis family transcriptional regulator [Nitrospirae bacterium]|nr:sigma-54-dependent Fis family transcriptional regulator [Candidatus Manganitrophaceae bacterium]